ncbi:hypothetical protein [Pseudomonas viridiflava]|uniref:hypothetical protein n=2 Tax=Pseudomonas viridiflava TaxID=33069 RepID=UPI000F0289FC|nr:hypothetical protein [Pseudomonas viridiflava]
MFLNMLVDLQALHSKLIHPIPDTFFELNSYSQMMFVSDAREAMLAVTGSRLFADGDPVLGSGDVHLLAFFIPKLLPSAARTKYTARRVSLNSLVSVGDATINAL